MMRKKDRIRSIWTDMHRRCSQPHRPDFKWYGGRGVTVCSDWNSLATFRSWAEAHGYAEKLTLERMDNSKPYCPENCTWVTVKVQDRNRRSNVRLEFNGETLCLSEWAEKMGVGPATLWMRLYKYGWSISDALYTPSRRSLS